MSFPRRYQIVVVIATLLTLLFVAYAGLKILVVLAPYVIVALTLYAFFLEQFVPGIVGLLFFVAAANAQSSFVGDIVRGACIAFLVIVIHYARKHGHRVTG